MKKLRLRKEIREFLDKAVFYLTITGWAWLIITMIRGGF